MLKFLLLLNLALVSSWPLDPKEEIAPNLDEPKDDTAKEPNVYRLSDDVIPLSYELKMVPDLKTFTFSGEAEIIVRVNNPTNKIELHSKELTIKDSKVMRGTRLIISDHKVDEQNELYVIQTQQSLTTGMEYVLEIEFEGVLKDNMKGFYKSSYTIDDKEYWIATTQFETAHAREAFPCFDEPRFRAKFHISVAHYPHQKATSNMPIENSSTQKDPAVGDRIWTQFKPSPPMATYLVAFVVSEFDFISDEDKKVNVWTRKNAIQQATYALQQGVKSLKSLESFTGIPYNLPKLDIMAIPDFGAGAMENWGMTTYREKYVILDQTTSSAVQRARATQVISHELAHQWFGDLVTPVWWDYLWLNEGFARYFEYFISHDIEPTWHFNEIFVVEQVQAAFRNEINTQRAMTTTVNTRKQMDEIFDVISYSKGGSIIRMFEHMVTPKVFKEALHTYLKDGDEKHKGTVTPDHLFTAFESKVSSETLGLPADSSVTQVMKTWTENIGFPLIVVKRNYTTGTVTIKQVTYQSLSATKPAPEQKWIVPLTYTIKSESKFSDTKPTLWSVADRVDELPKKVASEDWILFNLQQTGYYRVNYDTENWQLLINQLLENPEQIHVLNRAQMIDDSFTMYGDKKMCHPIPFQLVQYLKKETDMIPWYSAVEALRNWYLKYEGSVQEKYIQTFILDIIRPAYTNFGFHIQSTDGHLEKVVKSAFLSFACHLGLVGCRRNAIEMYKEYEKDLNKIQPDLKGVVYCEALRDHSSDPQKVFNNIWSAYLKSDNVNDKITILSSVGCTENKEIIKTLLEKIYDSKNKEIRKQDRFIIKGSIFKNIHAICTSIQFLIDKISTVQELGNEEISAMKSILHHVESRVKINHHLHLLKELESKLIALDQQKYGELTKLTQSAQTKGAKQIEEMNTKAEQLVKVLKEISPSLDPTTTPKTPSGGSSALASSLWTFLPIVIYSLYRTLSRFHIL